MKPTTLSLLSAAVLAFAAPACTDAGTDSSTAASTTGQARIAVVVTGDASSALDLTATDAATGVVAASQHLSLAADGSAAVTLALPEGDYDLGLAALADDGVTVTAHGDVAVAIAAQSTIELSATLDAAGGGGLQTETDQPPQLDHIDVAVIGDLAQGLDHLGDAAITVAASDADGGALTFFWSGPTITGSLQAGASLAIDNDAMVQARLAGRLDTSVGAQFFVVAEDQAGGAALGQITIGGNATCLLCGAANVQILAGASVGVADTSQRLAACIDAHVACEASCDAEFVHDGGDTQAHAGCDLSCAAELADCAAP